jgi:hypothetical protein
MALVLNVRLRRTASVTAAVLVLLLTEVYVAFNQTFDYSTFVVGLVVPLAAALVLFGRRGDRFLLYAYVGYLISIVDDAPVNLDSVFTWPQVTRLNPLVPHLTMELLLHVATIVFLYLSLRTALRGAQRALSFRVYLLLVIAFVLSYLQNLPISPLQSLVTGSWYELDVFEHLASLAVFAIALRGNPPFPPHQETAAHQ